MGMWLFLGQELLFFGGLFMAYIVFRWMYPDTWLACADHLNTTMGAVNTVVLIFSSLTMALGVREAQLGNNKRVAGYLAVTILCACAFLVVKYFEYSHKIHDGLLPGNFYAYAHDVIPGRPDLFFSIYFAMTGLHAIHVIAGILVLAWILKRSLRNDFGPRYYNPVENVGLYWHLVDLVWIFLFPLLYLVR